MSIRATQLTLRIGGQIGITTGKDFGQDKDEVLVLIHGPGSAWQTFEPIIPTLEKALLGPLFSGICPEGFQEMQDWNGVPKCITIADADHNVHGSKTEQFLEVSMFLDMYGNG